MDLPLLLALLAAVMAGAWVGARLQGEKDERGKVIALARGRAFWVPGSLWALSISFVALLLLALLYPLIWPEEARIRAALSGLTLVGEFRISDATNGSNTAPWRWQHGYTGADLRVDPAPGRRGKDGALRASFHRDRPHATIAVEVPGASLPDSVALAIAWVYVESSEAVHAAGLHASLTGRVNVGSGSFTLVGHRTALKPGAWTSVILSVSYALELSPALAVDSAQNQVSASNRRLENLSVRLESDRPFNGSVFIDDVMLFAPR